jgi:hypothetical protein|tara:strand:+ start:111 stop:587 length:477 start_codon:yes stop_codon:yes gene_type:complete
MDWEQLTIIAQITTGVATLAVATFLASQLRIQHRDSERDFAFAFENRQQDATLSVFGDESTRKLYWKALTDWDSLTGEEMYSFRFIYQQMYLGSWTSWRMRRDGDSLERYQMQWGQLLEYSGQRRFHEVYGRDILKRDQSLLNFVENVYQELESEQNA